MPSRSYVGKIQHMKVEDMNAILSRNLVVTLRARGLSMAEVSRRANASETLVHDIVNGRSRSPRIETVAKIAAALGVTVADLLAQGKRSQAEAAVLSALHAMPEADQQRLAVIAQAMAASQPE